MDTSNIYHPDASPAELDEKQPVNWLLCNRLEGGTYTLHPNGRESFVDTNGRREDRCPDGTKRIEQPSGGTTYILNKEPGFVGRLLGKRSPEQQALKLAPRNITR